MQATTSAGRRRVQDLGWSRAPLPGSSLVESGNGAVVGPTLCYEVGQVSASMATVPVPEEASRPMAPTLPTEGTVQVIVVHCP